MTEVLERRDIIGHGGGKSGAGGHTPVEVADSLHSISYARVLDLISEGEIKGLVNGMKSIFLDGTPLQNADGTLNFSGLTVDFRPGTQNQDHIAGFPSVENELGVGVELTSTNPYIRAVTNTELSAVRVRLGVPVLSKADTSTGDINGYKIEYAIDVATDGGAYQTALLGAFDGKTTNEYQRSHRIELPPANSGWLVRVRRITPNANSSSVGDITRIVSIAEIIDAKLRYPMSALMGIKVDAKQFQNVPTRSYLMDLRIIKVPTNYDPEARTYSGTWDGTFKLAWSNNPAWVFYDMVINDRFGLGHLVTPQQVDKWALYTIAQYCDVQVPDGKGGTEPRFTCNCYIQVQAEAYKLLSDLVSVFRGISYWGGGQVMTSCDMPSDPVYTYAPANVINGQFAYNGSRRKTRATVALVSWNDPADSYRAKVAYCEDKPGLARYGVRQITLTAFGCTSEAQAQRVGQWALLTSRLETGAVTFGVGLDGVIPAPGKIIAIADPHRAGRRMGGRIRSVAGRTVTLDKVPEEIVAGDTLTVALPSGKLQKQAITLVSDNVVTVGGDWTEAPRAQAMWLVEAANLKAQLFRVLSISERPREQNEDGSMSGLAFNITAVQHEPGKYALVDSGVPLDPRPISVLPPSVQPPPTEVTVTTRVVTDQGVATTVLQINWKAAANAVEYSVEWRKDSGDWQPLARTGSLGAEVPGIYAGLYVARVRAINVLGVPSLPALSVATTLTGKDTPPPAPTSLTTTSLVFSIALAWGFPVTGASDTQRTEVWYSTSNNRANAIKLGDFAYPQATHTLMGLSAGALLFFWVRLVDRTGNVGGWFPASATAGVAGQASSDATKVLEYLTDQISTSQLAAQLKADVQQIPNKTQTFKQSVTPVAKAIGDLWIDTGSKNLFFWSEDLTNWMQYTNQATAVAGTAWAAPDGTLTADKLNETTSAGGEHFLDSYQPYADGTGSYCYSVYAKAAERSGIVLRANSTDNSHSAWFNLTTLAVTNVSTGDAAEIISVGNGWYRCALKIANVSNVGSPIQRIYAWNVGLNTASYSGVAGAGVYLWGMQLEKSAGPGRYIRTTGAAVSTAGNNQTLRWSGATWDLSVDADLAKNSAAIVALAGTTSQADQALATRVDGVVASVTKTRRWSNTAAVNGNDASLIAAALKMSDGATAFQNGDQVGAGTSKGSVTYRVAARVASTSTPTGATSLFTCTWNGSAWAWTQNVLNEAGTTSNHVRLFLNAGVPSVRLYNHASTYDVLYDVQLEVAAYTAEASVLAEATARAAGDSANATLINTVKASLDKRQLGLPLEQWANIAPQGIITITDGKVGTTALQLAGNFGYPNMGGLVPIDRSKKYRVRFWARPMPGNTSGLLYFSLRQFLADGSPGPTNSGRAPYKPSGVSPTTHNSSFGANQWGEYSFVWASGDWQTGAVFVQPEFLDNYSGAAGTWQIQGWEFTDATATESLSAAIQTVSDAQVNGDAALATSITTVQSRLDGARAAGASIWPDPFVLDAASWLATSYSSKATVATISDGSGGTQAFRSPLGAQASARGSKRVPATDGRRYRVSALVRRSSDANGRLYLRVDWGSTDTGAYAELYPGSTALSDYSGGVENVVPTTAWARYSWELLPGSAVKFISPAILLNHGASAGYMDAQDIRIEDITDASAISASVQTEAATRTGQVNGITTALSAMYNIKTSITSGGRTYMSSIGVGTDNSSGVVESTILLSAAKVSIIDPTSGSTVSPFVVSGGQVFMNQALIGDAWITNAMIGNVIQSTSVGYGGAPRWKLDKTGGLTMTGANDSGYLAIDDTRIRVFDAGGVARVTLGKLS